MTGIISTVRKGSNAVNEICNINDCGQPRCAESEFWCRKHYILFRAAGMADQPDDGHSERPPGAQADEAESEPVITRPTGMMGIRSKIRPFREGGR